MLSLRAILILLKLPFNILLTALKTWFFGGKYRKYTNNILHHIRLLVCYTVLSLPTRDCSYIAISNSTLIRKIIGRKDKFVTSTIPGYGERYDKNSLWIAKHKNTKKTDPVLIFLHGGGYFIQTAPSQVEGIVSIYKLITPELQSKLNILFLDYDLASQGFMVPHQLHQYHETYLKLVGEGYTNIIVMGDSAGGHLAVTHMQYLKQKNFPVFPNKAILISPWVKLVPDKSQFSPGNSFWDNNKKDIIDFKNFADVNLISNIIGDADMNDLLISPGNKLPHDRNDWTGIPTFNDPGHDLFILAGEDEVIRDDILHWCYYALGIPLYNQYKYGQSNNKFDKSKHEYIRNEEGKAHVRLYVEPWGVHDTMLLLENEVINEFKKNKNLQVKDIDHEEYFGISRVCNFLNETVKIE